MSQLISCRSIGKSYGPQPLFQDISFVIFRGDKLGLIGPNGSGKSTLLKMLAGIESLDSGQVTRKKDIRLVYLAQKDFFPPGLSVEQVLMEAISHEELEDSERYTRVKRALNQAAFPQPEQEAASLSGGWQKRLAITRALLRSPDLLLMDEPTNHLDLAGIIWLEDILQNLSCGYVLVSHDRYFLDNTTNDIIELNRCYPDGFFRVKGGYLDFLGRRDEFLSAQSQLESSLANRMRRELEWLRRGPKARTTKAKFRQDDAAKLQNELNTVRGLNASGGKMRLQFNAGERRTKKLLRCHDLAKSMDGRLLFSQVGFQLSPGTRLGLLGGNGSGKSTLMKILIGELQPDQGQIETADNLRVAFFDQKREHLEQSQTLRQALSSTGDTVVYQDSPMHIVSWAKRFLFTPDQLLMPVSHLSGGEQARILIARLMLKPADILLLDEPTNDLDIPALEVLEESLLEFPGAVVLVCHDRYLLDRLCDTVLGLDGRGGAELYSDFSQWLRAITPRPPAKEKLQKIEKTPPRPATELKPKKLSYHEQRELEGMEATIMAAEEDLAECHRRLEDPEVLTQAKVLEDWCSRLQPAQQRVEQLYRRWEELEQKKTPSTE